MRSAVTDAPPNPMWPLSNARTPPSTPAIYPAVGHVLKGTCDAFIPVIRDGGLVGLESTLLSIIYSAK